MRRVINKIIFEDHEESLNNTRMNNETMDKILTEDRFKSLEEDAKQILMNRNKLNNRLFEKN